MKTRTEAAEYLASGSAIYSAEQLLESPDVVTVVFERQIRGHHSCNCERARRLLRALDILSVNAAETNGRLL